MSGNIEPVPTQEDVEEEIVENGQTQEEQGDPGEGEQQASIDQTDQVEGVEENYVDQEYAQDQYQDQLDPNAYIDWDNQQDYDNQYQYGDNWGYEDQHDEFRFSFWTDGTQDYSESTDYTYQDDGEDESLEEANLSQEGNDDTLRESIEEEEDETIAEPEFDFSPKQAQKKKSGPIELSKPALRWYSRKILADHIPTSEENLRRKRLLEKCQIVRKVSKPVLTIYGGKTKQAKSIDTDKVPTSEHESKQSVFDEEDEVDKTKVQKLKEYSEKEWAMKNTLDFLSKEGCSTSSAKTYSPALKAVREDADFRLDIYQKQLERRRVGIGHHLQAPEITDATRRHAERAICRAVIDNTKPRYPLPRFILPRHKYLKKVQAQFIGPGSYDIDVYEAQVKLRRMQLPSTWATCTSRFPKEKSESKNATEGTGILDPYESLDKANYKKKYPGTYIPFESTPKNFRKGLGGGGSGVPPNAYNIKSPLAEFIKQKTSLRGPYDCYTPSRGVIPYGYYKSENDEDNGRLGPGSYEIRTSLVKEMNDSYHIFKGVMGKAERRAMFGFKAAFNNPLWPPENPGIPPVGQYNPDKDCIGRDKAQYLAPFTVQEGLKKKDPVKPDMVAPDYYYFGSGTTWSVPPKGASCKSVFKSRTPQIMPQKATQVRRERNRPINRKFDIEGGGHHLEVHYAYDEPVQKNYALEDCNDPCLKPKGGPVVDPYAIPGHGVINLPGGKVIEKCCKCG